MILKQWTEVQVQARSPAQYPYGLAYSSFTGVLMTEVDTKDYHDTVVVSRSDHPGFHVRVLVEDVIQIDPGSKRETATEEAEIERDRPVDDPDSLPFEGNEADGVCPRCGKPELDGPDDEDNFDCGNCGLVIKL